MPTTEIVDCRFAGSSSWEGGPELIYSFQTLTGSNVGSRFSCQSSQITWQVQSAIDGSDTVIRARVSTEQDYLGAVALIEFIKPPGDR
jgi:hypothetical protein